MQISEKIGRNLDVSILTVGIKIDLEIVTKAAIAVQSSAPIFPPCLNRAHIRNTTTIGLMTKKMIAGMYTK